jgi:hypothetical protein
MMLYYPRMIFYLLKSKPLLWVKNEDVLDQVSNFGGEMIRELQVDVPNTLISFIVVMRFEWREATAEFKAQDAKTPDVHSFVMRLLNDHFRWQIIQGPTESLPAIIWGMNAPPEIRYLDSPLLVS